MSQESNAWIIDKLIADRILAGLIGGVAPYERPVEDDCDSDLWSGTTFRDTTYHPGWLRHRRYSSPPPVDEATLGSYTVNLDNISVLKYSIPEVQGPYFQWRLLVRTGAGDTTVKDWSSDTGEWTVDLVDDLGMSGTQTIEFVLQVRYDGGYPSDFTTWVCMDYLYLENFEFTITDEIIIAEPEERPPLLEDQKALIVLRSESEVPNTLNSQGGDREETIYIEIRSWTKQTVHDIKARVQVILEDLAGALDSGGCVYRVRHDWNRAPYKNADGVSWESQIRYIVWYR